MSLNSDRRTATRKAVNFWAQVLAANGATQRGTVVDISATGLVVMIDDAIELGEQILVSSPEIGEKTGQVVRKFSGGVAIAYTASAHQSAADASESIQVPSAYGSAIAPAQAYFASCGHNARGAENYQRE